MRGPRQELDPDNSPTRLHGLGPQPKPEVPTQPRQKEARSLMGDVADAQVRPPDEINHRVLLGTER